MLNLNLPTHFNAAHYLVDRHVGEGRGGCPAILFEDEIHTYDQLRQQVNRVGHMLKGLGVEMENRVMLLVRDSPQMVFSFLGAIKLGAIPIPTNILMKSRDFLHVLNDSRAKVLIVDSVFLAEIEKILDQAPFCRHVVVIGGGDHPYLRFEALTDDAPTALDTANTTPDDAAFWLYSGRNPERLMGAVHHHSHMVFCAEAYAKGVLNMTPDDRVMGSFLFFAYGLGNSVYHPFSVGGATVLANHRPTPDLVYADLIRYKPTLFFTVPTLLGALVDYRKTNREEGKELPAVEGLRACISSAEILSPDVYHRFKDEFGVEILDGTGSTEICHIFLSNFFGDVKPGSTGKVVPGYETRLVDEDGNPTKRGETGHLLVKGGSIASAYWNLREETKENMLGEWFVTGDRYRVDEGGYYYFKGRSDDMLRVGGKWLSPMEVEGAINSHPAVQESAVVGYQDEDALIKPYAFVVLKPEASGNTVLEEEIKGFVKEKISLYKYPRWIEFISELPKTSGGKVQRFILQEKLNV
jgi:benzoate-CoA ligase